MRSYLLSVAAGLSMLAYTVPPAAAQGFGGVDCQGSVSGLMAERDKAGKVLQAASKKKADLKTVCRMFRQYVAIETKALSFLKTNKVQCGVPDQFLKQFTETQAKSSQTATKVCQAAANGGEPARPPSAGLSDALGVNTVGGTGAGEKPSAVFDTLHGNVLAQ